MGGTSSRDQPQFRQHPNEQKWTIPGFKVRYGVPGTPSFTKEPSQGFCSTQGSQCKLMWGASLVFQCGERP